MCSHMSAMAMYTPTQMPVDIPAAKLLCLTHERHQLFVDQWDKYRAIEYLPQVVRDTIIDAQTLALTHWLQDTLAA